MRPYNVKLDVVQASGVSGWTPRECKVWASDRHAAIRRAIATCIKCGAVPIVAWRLRELAPLDLTQD
jgi:hypothetical protein